MRRNALLSSVLTLLFLSLAFGYLYLSSSAAANRACRIEPRSQAEVLTLAGRPLDRLIIPASDPQPHPWSRGDTLSDGSVAAPLMPLLATMREAVACARAHDTQRLYALYSDDFLRRDLRSDAESGTWQGLPAVPVWRGTWHLRNGRVGAVFSEPVTSDAPPVRQPVYVVFIRSGDRWLIDDAIPFAPREDEETTS